MTDTQKTLFSKYLESSPFHQGVLEMLAAIVQPITRNNLLRWSRRTQLRNDKGAKVAHQQLYALIRKLTVSGFVRERGSKIEIDDSVRELVARESARHGRFQKVVDASNLYWRGLPLGSGAYYGSSIAVDTFERVRIAVYRNEGDTFSELGAEWYRYNAGRDSRDPLDLIFNHPFDREWLMTREELMRETVANHIVTQSLSKLTEARGAVEFMAELAAGGGSEVWWTHQALGQYYLLSGSLPQADALIEQTTLGLGAYLNGIRNCQAGNYERAAVDFGDYLAQARKGSRKRFVLLPPLAVGFYVIALLGTDDGKRIREGRKYIEQALAKHPEQYTLYTALRCALDFAEGKTQEAGQVADLVEHIDAEPLAYRIFVYTVVGWVKPRTAGRAANGVRALKKTAEEGGFDWVAAECASLQAKLAPEGDDPPPRSHEQMGTVPIWGVIGEKSPWERTLAALGKLSESVKVSAPKQPAAASRLTWRIDGHSPPRSLSPFVQKMGKTGKWTKGAAVALKRLHQRTNVAFISDQDAQICGIIELVKYSRGTHYYLDVAKSLDTLVGHPLLFRKDDPKTGVEVVRAEPQLRVTTEGENVHIKLVPDPPADGDVLAKYENPTRLTITRFAQQHREILSLLGKSGFTVPQGFQDQITKAVAAVSSLVTVHSDIGGGDHAVDVPADPTPNFLLTPYEAGLRAEPVVQPFSTEGPTYAPGSGGTVVFAIVAGKRSKTTRDRAQESLRFDKAVAACPSLHYGDWDGTAWTLPDPLASLELLEELHSLGDSVVVRWPQGESLKVKHRATPGRLQLKIRKSQDWFKIDGSIQFDSGLVMTLHKLLEEAQNAEGRFLPIGNKQFIALTEQFRRRIEELSALVDRHGKGLRFHSSRSHALEGLVEDAGSVSADEEWGRRLQSFRDAQSLEPRLPSTLQADLREYQVEGYQWAARLAAWGVGACLADDMGLGKTLQALTVALDRAPSGPTLVVAPTSVCPNWIDETRRFTPTLRAFLFGHGDRAQMIENLAPFDLMVCSYGLLPREIDRLEAVEWETVILDEAQAIKNRETMRSRAAMRLAGRFRMITTGTPIENHLGELWNLFQFINPGLLGSLESFTKKFAQPIHQSSSAEAKRSLKRLIQPFILRRTKSAVLDELPPRTEITIRVEMSAKEAALYEALRQRAVLNVEDHDKDGRPGHLQILAEIMKLRRACCHPRLVAPELGIEDGAKLESFGYTVRDLLSNGHKALVFSQFVDHLSIIRSYLDQQGIEYRYLDGSTPQRKRKREVDAFQAGQGDLFLISLRAGGQGLNLTAADYVLHLDPWWNPAVEDQASDRAHRIGQVRPVTIYRFVMKGTIEEKIVDLHASKRDLADSLLEGAEMSGKMSAEELLQLLRHD